MRILLAGLALVLALSTLGTLALVAWIQGSDAPASQPLARSPAAAAGPGPLPADLAERVRALDERLARLEQAVERLGRSGEPTRSAAGTPSAPATAPAAEDAGPVGPEWYLEQYVRSFDGGGPGSEFYRLAVEAHVRVLAGRIADALLSSGEHGLELARALALLLGDRRLADDPRAERALLAVLSRTQDPTLAATALESLTAVGGPRAAGELEHLVWRLAHRELLPLALGLIVALAGEEGNRAILRLMRTAPDDEAVALLLGWLRPSDVESALDALALARGHDPGVRLAAAQALQGLHDDRVLAFVEGWLPLETDPGVRQALERARARLRQVPAHHPRQATGPPDAVPGSDDPRAWASRQPDAGAEWLELGFAGAQRASAVRIHQVNVGGAVVEVVALEPGGAAHTLWRGRSDARVGRFEIRFPTTPYLVQGLRIVLDTRLAAGWNEIDAVELIGPEGSAFATSARASSYFGM